MPRDLYWMEGRKVSNADLQGRVVLYDFWEYTCINCIRTFPHLKQWYARYRDAGLEIIGIHRGEFGFAMQPANSERAYRRLKLPYPSIADRNDQLWHAFDSNTWPNSFLTDRSGVIRIVHSTEGDYGKLEREIQALLKQGHPELDFSKFDIPADKPISGPECGEETEEIYVGYDKGSHWGGALANDEGFQPNNVVDYRATKRRTTRGCFVQGKWRNRPDDFEAAAISTDAAPVSVGIRYTAREVYGVFDRASKEPARWRVTRDGKPIPPELRGKDILVDEQGNTTLNVDESRMYYLIAREDEDPTKFHELQLFAETTGARICSFTFGNRCLEDFDRL